MGAAISTEQSLRCGLARAAAVAGNDIDRCLELAEQFGASLPAPGKGRTLDRWSMLAITAAADLTAARVLEAHADALAILDEAGLSQPTGAAPTGTWGVFAAEAPGTRLEYRDGALTGTKPWCSLGDRLDHALVTAVDGDRRLLVAVDLDHPSVRSDPPERWVAHGLPHVTSVSLHFEATPVARLVAEPEWYLRRPGFAWGGIGVAACWFGGALGLQESLRAWARAHRGDLTDLAVGVVDLAIGSARDALRHAAARVDAGSASGADGDVLALRARSTVAQAAEIVLEQVAHAAGPAPLAFDETHARRVADLGLYLRQHHAERDVAALGHATADLASPLAALRRCGL